MYGNQNRIGTVHPLAEKCPLRMHDSHGTYSTQSNDSVTLDFGIRGGSDNPHLALMLIIDYRGSLKSMETLFLLGVTRVGADTERPIARLGRDDPNPAPLIFSGCLKNLTFDVNHDFSDWLNIEALDTGHARPAYVCFEPRDYECINLNTEILYVPRADRIAIEVFR